MRLTVHDRRFGFCHLSYSVMSDKRKSYECSDDSDIKKRSRKPITLETKAELIKLSDGGMRSCDICQKFNLSASTVATVLKNKTRILEEVRKYAPFLSTVTRKRDGLISEMENILVVWVHDRIRHRFPLSLKEVQAKALSLFENLREHRGEGSSEDTFQASKGWLCRFQARHNLHNFKTLNEVAFAEIDAANDAPIHFSETGEMNEFCKKEIIDEDVISEASEESEDPLADDTTNANLIDTAVEVDSEAEILQSQKLIKREQVEDTDLQVSADQPHNLNITTTRLKEAFTMLERAMAIFGQDDGNLERSSKVNAALRRDYACYKEIYRAQRRVAVQHSLDSFSVIPETPELKFLEVGRPS